MSYTKSELYPSVGMHGIYPPGSDEQLGINTDNLENLSLGNWNSIKGNDKIYKSSFGDFYEFIEKGRPVKIIYQPNLLYMRVFLDKPDGTRQYFGPGTGRSIQSYDTRIDFSSGHWPPSPQEDENYQDHASFPDEPSGGTHRNWKNELLNDIGGDDHLTIYPQSLLPGLVSTRYYYQGTYPQGSYVNLWEHYEEDDANNQAIDLGKKLVLGKHKGRTDNPTSGYYGDWYGTAVYSTQGERVVIYEDGNIGTEEHIAYIVENDGEGDTFKVQLDEEYTARMNYIKDLEFIFEVPDSTRAQLEADDAHWNESGQSPSDFFNYKNWWPYFDEYISANPDHEDLNLNIQYKLKVAGGETSAPYWNASPNDNSFGGSVDGLRMSPYNPTEQIGEYGEHEIVVPIVAYSNGVLTLSNEDIKQGGMYYTRDGHGSRYPIIDPYPVFGFPNFKPKTAIDKINLTNVSDSLVKFNDNYFQVLCHSENNNELLYYDYTDNKNEYIDTSYPVKVNLSVDVFETPWFSNTYQVPSSPEKIAFINLVYGNSTNTQLNSHFNDYNNIYKNIFYYNVIQWGDEDKLLTNDQILSSPYFHVYETDVVDLTDKSFNSKKSAQYQLSSRPIRLGRDMPLIKLNHLYTSPGIKSIKIIIYRFTADLGWLMETTLVTKNILINSGLKTAQDFSIFGGTDFNFLPLKTKDIEGEGEQRPLEAIIGGLDEDSKYNNSVEKIKKDDNFTREDYLERVSSREFIDNFNKKLYGETPGQLDLSITRMYKKPLDIYDFITDDKQSIVDNNFNLPTGDTDPLDKLPINSSATDIFISNNDCIVDLNPHDIEYLSIQNKTGTADKTVLIGDYKVNQPKDGRVQKQGVMQTPLLEQNTDKQAF